MRRHRKSTKRVRRSDSWQKANRQLLNTMRGMSGGLDRVYDTSRKQLSNDFKVLKSLSDPGDPEFKHAGKLYMKAYMSLIKAIDDFDSLRQFMS